MWHGGIIMGIGIWLVFSGLISSLQHPVNMVVTGFFTAICCFSSSRIWHASALGILGLWLFLSGIHDWAVLSTRSMVNSTNFLIVSILLVGIGLWCIIFQIRAMAKKGQLGTN